MWSFSPPFIYSGSGPILQAGWDREKLGPNRLGGPDYPNFVSFARVGRKKSFQGDRQEALHYNFPHGGWCPKGRLSLDGPIPEKYQLTETPSASYPQRTEWNVRDSDGTVVFTFAEEPTGGSLKTVGFAKKHKKPCLHIHKRMYDPAERLIRFVNEHDIQVLNVAGSRESKEPGI